MKRNSLTIISTALLLLVPVNSFAATKASVSKPKSAGRTIAATTNTILSGITPPNSLIGINGDFYIDTKNSHIYGPKTKGKWLLPTPLKGSQGAAGADGKNGLDAKLVSSSSLQSGTQGPQGERGATGATGPQGPSGASGSGSGPAGATGPTGAKGDTGISGAKGDTGLTGSMGSPGATGSTGLTGPTGPSGSNGTNGSAGSTGAQGSIGLTGFTGANGDRGATGSNGIDGTNGTNGAKGADGTNGTNGTNGSVGEKGATGAAGPSNSYFINIPSWSLSTGTPKSSNSLEFGTLIANTSYTFQIILDGTFSIANSSAFYFDMQVNTTSNLSLVSSQLFVSDAKGYVNSIQSRHYMFNIIGTISTGANPAALILTATDVVGITGTAPLSISGKCVLNLVGQVG